MGNTLFFGSARESCLDMNAVDMIISPSRTQDRLLQISTVDALDQSANVNENLC